jgi:hypothetical protein
MDEPVCIECGSNGKDARLTRCPICKQWVCPYCAEDEHDCTKEDDQED